MIDNSREYIICSAMWYKDKFPEESPRGFVAQNISEGMVIGQWRHGNCMHVRRQMGLPKKGIGTDERAVQGFLTSKGNFVDRVQAAEIAYNAGQISKEKVFRDDWTGKYKTALGDEPRERWADAKDYPFWNLFSEDIY